MDGPGSFIAVRMGWRGHSQELWRERTPFWVMKTPLNALTGFPAVADNTRTSGHDAAFSCRARGNSSVIRIAFRRVLEKLQTSIAGLSPETIALIFALGLVLGVFPVFGVPTVLCSIAAIVFRVNLPAIQLVNQVCSPLQYALLIPLGRAGAQNWYFPPEERPRAVESLNIVHTTGNAGVVGWCCFCLPVRIGALSADCLRAAPALRAGMLS